MLLLEVGFIGLIMEALFCCFEEHIIIYPAQLGYVQAVVDTIEKCDLVVDCRSSSI